MWIGNKTPFSRFPRLYYLTFSRNILVARMFGEGWNSLKFRRILRGEIAVMWQRLQNLCSNVVLNDIRIDVFGY